MRSRNLLMHSVVIPVHDTFAAEACLDKEVPNGLEREPAIAGTRDGAKKRVVTVNKGLANVGWDCEYGGGHECREFRLRETVTSGLSEHVDEYTKIEKVGQNEVIKVGVVVVVFTSGGEVGTRSGRTVGCERVRRGGTGRRSRWDT